MVFVDKLSTIKVGCVQLVLERKKTTKLWCLKITFVFIFSKAASFGCVGGVGVFYQPAGAVFLLSAHFRLQDKSLTPRHTPNQYKRMYNDQDRSPLFL